MTNTDHEGANMIQPIKDVWALKPSDRFEPPPPCTPAERKRAEELGAELGKRYHASEHFVHNPHTTFDGKNPTYKGNKGNTSNHGKTKVAEK